MTLRLDTAQRNAAFGLHGDHSRMTTALTPWGITVTVNTGIKDVFLAACAAADRASAWKPHRIDSYANRAIRGSSEWSLHSWAMAWDFFATGPNVPPPGGVWNPTNGVPPDFAAAFERLGFTWGAKFSSRQDHPHIEWAGPPPTGNYNTEDLNVDEIKGWLQDVEKLVIQGAEKSDKVLAAVWKQTGQIDTAVAALAKKVDALAKKIK